MNERIWDWPELLFLYDDMIHRMPVDDWCHITYEVGESLVYLQSWDIYMWGEPNESSLLLRNERGE